MALIINGETISDDIIEEEFDAIKRHHEALGEVVCCDRDEEFHGYAIENITNRTLLRQHGLKHHDAPADPAIDAHLETLKAQHETEDAFFDAIGLGPEQMPRIREKVAETLIVNAVLDEAAGPEPDPSEDDYRQFYQDHLEDYMTPEEVRSWHIYIEPSSPEDAAQAFQTLRRTRKALQEGADFESLCRELCVSDHQMDLGWYARGSLMQEVEILTFSMDIDEISPVVATHFGYHIFKLVDRREPKPIPFEEVREKIVERYPSAVRESKIQALLDRLRNDAKIEEVEPVPEEA